MPKIILSTLLVFLFLFPVSIFSAGLTLTNIGGLSTDKQYGEWWYSSENPVLKGTASPDSTVTIGIDSIENNTTANSSGVWSYQPTTLNKGDHNVQIKSAGSTYGFVLHIGSTMPSSVSTKSSTSSAKTNLPVSGTFEITLVFLALSLGSIFYGFKLSRRNA